MVKPPDFHSGNYGFKSRRPYFWRMRKVITLSPLNIYGDIAQLAERRQQKLPEVSVRVRFQYQFSIICRQKIFGRMPK